MGLLRAILDVLKRLLGLGSAAVPSLQLDGVTTPAGELAAGDDDDDDDDDDADDDDADDDDADDAETDEFEDAWGDLQALIAKFEAEAIDLAGLDPEDPESFWSRAQAIERAGLSDEQRDAAAREAGFGDLGHWQRVREYMHARWSRLPDEAGAATHGIALDPVFVTARERVRAAPRR